MTDQRYAGPTDRHGTSSISKSACPRLACLQAIGHGGKDRLDLPVQACLLQRFALVAVNHRQRLVHRRVGRQAASTPVGAEHRHARGPQRDGPRLAPLAADKERPATGGLRLQPGQTRPVPPGARRRSGTTPRSRSAAAPEANRRTPTRRARHRTRPAALAGSAASARSVGGERSVRSRSKSASACTSSAAPSVLVAACGWAKRPARASHAWSAWP